MNDDGLALARLIPVKGISSSKEAEERATSALLAVLSIVRPYSKRLLGRLGASKADKATVECFTEVRFKHPTTGKEVRPDGLIRVRFGQQTWIALVEVKTGSDELDPDQLQKYLDVARDQRFAHVLTISNQIASANGAHPSGIRQRKDARVQMSHISWSRLLTEAVMEKVHRGVDDPEQAWILGELIRYLEHPASGAMHFDDMGPTWTAVRDLAKAGTIDRKTDGVDDLVDRWAQLIQYVALRLGAGIGADVQPVLSQAQRNDPARLHADTLDTFCDLRSMGQLAATLRIPDTIADLAITADLRGEHIEAVCVVPAPADKTPRGQVGWLLRQLRANGPTDCTISAWGLRKQRPHAEASLADAVDDPSVLIGPDRADIARFEVRLRRPLGRNRKSGGKTPGFAQSVDALVAEYYGMVLEHLRPYVVAAPSMRAKDSPVAEAPSDPIPGAVNQVIDLRSTSGAPPAPSSDQTSAQQPQNVL
ncbi:MAG: hypothetical protein AAGC53_14535 [Actinomycetota bacterium]